MSICEWAAVCFTFVSSVLHLSLLGVPLVFLPHAFSCTFASSWQGDQPLNHVEAFGPAVLSTIHNPAFGAWSWQEDLGYSARSNCFAVFLADSFSLKDGRKNSCVDSPGKRPVSVLTLCNYGSFAIFENNHFCLLGSGLYYLTNGGLGTANPSTGKNSLCLFQHQIYYIYFNMKGEGSHCIYRLCSQSFSGRNWAEEAFPEWCDSFLSS